MGKENEVALTSYAIDCNGESRLLTDVGTDKKVALVSGRRLIPTTAATYSLFSENSLFLNQD